jgi:hypothetical protein
VRWAARARLRTCRGAAVALGCWACTQRSREVGARWWAVESRWAAARLGRGSRPRRGVWRAGRVGHGEGGAAARGGPRAGQKRGEGRAGQVGRPSAGPGGRGEEGLGQLGIGFFLSSSISFSFLYLKLGLVFLIQIQPRSTILDRCTSKQNIIQK